MPTFERWCRVTVVGPDGADREWRDLGGIGAPDLGTVDAVARLALASGREGCTVRLSEVSSALAELLELSGISSATGRSLEAGH